MDNTCQSPIALMGVIRRPSVLAAIQHEIDALRARVDALQNPSRDVGDRHETADRGEG